MSENNKAPKAGNYKVGYRRPPKHAQFKKGESGNRRGRPRGTLNIATVLAKALRERVVINENGKRRVVTKLEAAAKQLVNKAASGDLAALRQLFGLALMAEERSVATASTTAVISEIDQKVMLGILQRYGSGLKEGSDEARDR